VKTETSQEPVQNAADFTAESTQRVTFHIAEFTALKKEVLEDIKSASANFQYAATLSGGIAAWLLSFSFEKTSVPTTDNIPLAGAYWLPLLFTILLFGLWVAINWRFKFKGEYLLKVENVLGFKDLGWEKTWARRRSMRSPVILWVTLIILDMLLGALGIAIFFGCLKAA
jgi:hypothetical protein